MYDCASKYCHTKYIIPKELPMSALSIRLSAEVEKRLEMEVSRLKVTKSRFVQDLLESALAPKDALALMQQARRQFGLDEAAQTAPLTHKASQVKALVREAVQKKHAAEKLNAQEAELQVAEPQPSYNRATNKTNPANQRMKPSA
jgi:predicted DNA-binding protein